MTIYFAGGEDTSFTVVGTVLAWNLTNSFGLMRSNFSRAALVNSPTNITATMPPSSYLLTPVFTSVSSLWFHCQYGMFSNGNNATTSNAPAIWFLDAGGVARIVIRGTGTAGQWKISTRNAAGSFVDLATSASGLMNNAGVTIIYAIEIFVNYSTSGQVTMYINGVNSLDTGPGVNVTTDSATTLAQVGIQGFTNNNTATGFSEVIVADGATSTIGMALWTLQPQASGTTQSWTPNTVGNISEIGINDTTMVSTASNNALCEWTTPTAYPGGSWGLVAIAQEARVQRASTGPQHFEWLIRTIDGTQNVTGSVAPPLTWTNYSNIWNTNPHTAAAWAVGDIAAGFNTGIESLA